MHNFAVSISQHDNYMNKVFLKNVAFWFSGLAMMNVVACSDSDKTEMIGLDQDEAPVVFKGMAYRGAAQSDDESLSEVIVYHFKGDDYILRTEISDPGAEGITLPSEGTTRIFCLSGLDLDASEGSTKQADFAAALAKSQPGAVSAPLFFSAAADFTGGPLEIQMKRSVARIDFTNNVDPQLTVSQIAVMDAPAETYVFECGKMPETSTVTYSKTFDSPFRGTVENLFNIFESEKPVELRILGTYGDSPLNISVSLPSVERNKIYTLQTVNVNSCLTGAFTVKDWEEGDRVEAAPNSSKGIYLDKVNTVVPEGVEVDYSSNSVSVPASGVSGMKLAFVSSRKLSLSSVEGLTDAVKVTDVSHVAVEEGFISTLNVSIDPQPNGGVAYQVILHLKDDRGKYNFVEIKVPEYHYIETVKIAGLTWMSFNTMGQDADRQVFPFDGISVEEMYRQNWVQSIGCFFQYGRAKSYSPWTRNDPEGNSDTPRDIPWVTPECMPMPQGFHVATTAEWLQLLPSGTQIPSTYTAGNGEQIKSEIVTLPGTLNDSPCSAANRAGLLKRYIRFESLETGNVLILPVCGVKTASFDEFPGSGAPLHSRVLYWVAEERYIWIFQIGENEDGLYSTQKRERWNYNGFMAVRGVKDPE